MVVLVIKVVMVGVVTVAVVLLVLVARVSSFDNIADNSDTVVAQYINRDLWGSHTTLGVGYGAAVQAIESGVAGSA